MRGEVAGTATVQFIRTGQPACDLDAKQHLEQPNWVWVCDEICWFSRQPFDYRNSYLRCAKQRVRELDPNEFLQMPGARRLIDPIGEVNKYQANMPSAACPTGFGQEEAIRIFR